MLQRQPLPQPQEIKMFTALNSLVKSLNELSNTFWGMVILIGAMIIAKNNHDVGYYFAGIGSTLVGINYTHPNTTKQG
jgi:hypothetical protein